MDTTKKAPPTRRDNAVFWICLPLAGILWFFAGGRYVVGAAAWLGPVFMLRWFRGRRASVAFPLALLAAGTAGFFGWRGIADVMMPTAFYVVFSAVTAAVYLLPYLADRALYRYPGGFSSTLIFPAAVVTLEYTLSLASPLGTWNAVAYTQVGNLPLIQISSLTGIYGVSFVVAWFAGVANWAWEEKVAGRDIGRGLAIYGAVLATVMLFGGVRLAVTRAGDTVRVAGIITPTFFLSEHREVLEPLIGGEALDDNAAATMREETAAINDDLLTRSRREARAGAKIILWGEASAQLSAEDEPALLARGRELARREAVYLGMALATLEPGADKPVTNKFVLVDPDGAVVWDYVKSIPVPGPEAAISRRGDGVIPTAETEYGKLAGVICYDMDFPAMIRPAGRAGADVMVVPGHDWYELGDLHADLAIFRAVENGFSLFRPDNEAISIATDYLGKPLATMDYFAADDPVIIAEVPTAGVRTLYAAIGDVFAWLVILYLGTTTTIILIRTLRKTTHRDNDM